ncbi:MAG: metallophosphoesterase family protein [Dehalococcoidia bacterium]|nr:metallophosphoesterase family protein [Dehalococcoidia bacterium]
MGVEIIALSDSHAAALRELPITLVEAIHTADIIIHAGDHTEMSLLEQLRGIGQVVAVSGNMDSTSIKLQLPHRQLVSVNNKTIGVTHGAGAAAGISRRVRQLFPENPDAIVFGHSHVPFCEVVDGVLMVNPGSAHNSYARITVDDKVTAEVITL